MPRLPPSPDLTWNEDGAPHAVAFDDVYFSRRGGLAESDAVFLTGCGLPDAWQDKPRFAIAELGFGTGLNVLAAWRLWRQTRSPHAQLHIFSVEAFPLARADAARALSAFPEIADLAEQLLACWPVRARAPQRLWFPDDGFALTLAIGEATEVLRGAEGRFDAWFLDGFAPSRNPEMWSPALFAEIARLSAPGARAATFTVAGAVRRGLQEAGFEVEKREGFGAKRERLEARLETPPPQPHPLYPYAAAHPKRVAILGAGIAGAATARALARRGAEVIVLEAAPQLGAGASGNPAGLVMPRLDRGDGPLTELFLAAYLDAVRAYEALGPDVFAACGVEEGADEEDRAAFNDLLADPPLPDDWFAPLNAHVLHKRAGVVRPLAAIRAWLEPAHVMCDAPVAALERVAKGWRLLAPDGRAILQADAIVLACGAGLTQLDAARFLPIHLSRGQIEWGPLVGAPPPRAYAQSSYHAPFDGGLLFGATFDRVEALATRAESADDRARNLAALAMQAPEVAARLDLTRLSSRASVRATTKDYAPIAGLMPEAEAWLDQNSGIAHGRPHEGSKPAPALDGVYLIGGLGARGLTLAPLLGERIAAEMFGEPQTLSRRALDAIHPARFLHRTLKKRSK